LRYTVEILICVSRLTYYSKTVSYKIVVDSRQEKLYSSLQLTQTRRIIYKNLESVFRHNSRSEKQPQFLSRHRL